MPLVRRVRQSHFINLLSVKWISEHHEGCTQYGCQSTILVTLLTIGMSENSNSIQPFPNRHYQVPGGNRDRSWTRWPGSLHHDLKHLQASEAPHSWVRRSLLVSSEWTITGPIPIHMTNLLLASFALFSKLTCTIFSNVSANLKCSPMHWYNNCNWRIKCKHLKSVQHHICTRSLCLLP